MVIRLRRSRRRERQQLRWSRWRRPLLVVGIVMLVVVQGLNGGRPDLASAVPLLLSPTCCCRSVLAVAVLRYRLYDVDVIINRAVVARRGRGVRRRRLHRRSSSRSAARSTAQPAASGSPCSRPPLVALAFQPLRRRVVRLADRLAYGAARRALRRALGLQPPARRAAPPRPRCSRPSPRRPAARSRPPRRDRGLDVDPAGRRPRRGRLGRRAARTAADGRTTSPCADGGRSARVRSRSAVPGRGRCAPPTSGCCRRSPTRRRWRSATPRWRPSSPRTSPSSTGTTDELAESRRRLIEAERRRAAPDLERRSPATSCRTWSRCPATLEAGAGRPSRPRRIDALVDETNAALEALRELTRGVFPTLLARAGLEPALPRTCSAGSRAAAVDPAGGPPVAARAGARPGRGGRLLLLRARRTRHVRRDRPWSSRSSGPPWCCEIEQAVGAPGGGAAASLDRVEARRRVTVDRGRRGRPRDASVPAGSGRASVRPARSACPGRWQSRSGPERAPSATYAAAPHPARSNSSSSYVESSTTTGPPAPADVIRRVASMPSMPGRLTSISTRSGRSSRDGGERLLAGRAGRPRRSRRSPRPRPPSRGGTAPGRRRPGRAPRSPM